MLVDVRLVFQLRKDLQVLKSSFGIPLSPKTKISITAIGMTLLSEIKVMATLNIYKERFEILLNNKILI